MMNITPEFASPIGQRGPAEVARSAVVSSLADAILVSGPMAGAGPDRLQHGPWPAANEQHRRTVAARADATLAESQPGLLQRISTTSVPQGLALSGVAKLRLVTPMKSFRLFPGSAFTLEIPHHSGHFLEYTPDRLLFFHDARDARERIRGARRAELVELSRLLETDKVRFMPYQPRDQLPYSLSAASVHVVGLSRRLAGYVVPSRLYGILAVARPVIVAADQESETARVVEHVGCGVVVPPGRRPRHPEMRCWAARRTAPGVVLVGTKREAARSAMTENASDVEAGPRMVPFLSVNAS